MKRAILSALLLIVLIPCLNAQKKELSQARTYIKSGSDYDKAEELMTQLLKDSANTTDINIRLVLAEAVKRQYDKINQSLYLGEKYDTASLFVLTRKMFMAYQGVDSIDAMPDDKGRVKPKYRKKNAEYVNALRPNLYSGGVYFIRKQQYAQAYQMLETYIDCQNQPLFQGMKSDGKETEAAYWALFSGYKQGDVAKVIKHAAAAMNDTARTEHVYRYLTDTYRQNRDTALYLATLKKAFNRYRSTEYFYTRLIDYYNACKLTDSAMAVIDTAISAKPNDETLLLLKSGLLLNTGEYLECIAVCDTLIATIDTIADAYYNAGVAYVNMAFGEERRDKTSREAINKAREHYRKALPYMETYRRLRPNDKDKWAAALYNIYLRLNMGKEFEEIDRMLR